MEHDPVYDRSVRRHALVRGMPLCVLLLAGMTVLLAAVPAGATGAPGNGSEYDPAVAALLAEIEVSELRNTTYDLQNFSTRAYGSGGNREAGEYLFARVAGIPGLEVKFQGGDLKNVVATLPGSGDASDGVVVVGAHYDSTSPDPARAPGATDNGCGVAIVLELARVMSRHPFDRTVQFAFWNAEEVGRYGSADYAGNASVPVVLSLNYDSACYDPENRSVLDIVYDERSADIAALMADHNTLYAVNFTLTRNNHTCVSDHTPFQAAGYPAVTTHAEEHGPAHTPDDTADRVSFEYAKRNAQLGLSVIAEVAGLRDEGAGAASPEALPPDGTDTAPGTLALPGTTSMFDVDKNGL